MPGKIVIYEEVTEKRHVGFMYRASPSPIGQSLAAWFRMTRPI